MSNFTDVKTFMETFGQIVRTKPQFPDEKTMQLRYDLIKEELNELEQAMKSKESWRFNCKYVLTNGTCRGSNKKCLQYE